MKKRVGKRDFVFFCVISILLILIIIWFYVCKPVSGNQVVITINGIEYGTYDLETDQRIEILNENGQISNVLLISSKQAKMIEADCPDKLCMHQNAISYDNENIVCLPNRVVATVISKESEEIDAIAK